MEGFCEPDIARDFWVWLGASKFCFSNKAGILAVFGQAAFGSELKALLIGFIVFAVPETS
jgi:hypothetical protein